MNTIEKNNIEKILLYKGMIVPFGELSSDKFENFVYSVLIELGPKKGFKISSKPANTGDEGFDIIANRISDSKLICIQCKRYTNTPLTISHLSNELVKVALNNYIEKIKVIEHYIISSGDIRNNLNQLLKKNDKSEIFEKAKNEIMNKDFSVLRGKINKNVTELQEILKNYINELEGIYIWSGSQFDCEISTIYSQLSDIINRFFQLEPYLIEHPRPNFDENKYILDCISNLNETNYLVNLKIIETGFPENLSKQSFESPLNENKAKENEEEIKVDNIYDLLKTKNGDCNILIGKGGSGKTISLKMILKYVAELRRENKDSILPVLINLGSYDGDIDKIIHESLNIYYGHWSSLPCNFLLLCDGLDELSPDLQTKLFRQLENKIYSTLSIVLSIRSNGLNLPQTFKIINKCFELRLLSFEQIKEISKIELTSDKYPIFMDFVYENYILNGKPIMALPFYSLLAIDIYKSTGNLIFKQFELIDQFLNKRFIRNTAITNSLKKELLLIPFDTFKELLERIAFFWRIEKGKVFIKSNELREIIIKVLQEANKENLFGIKNISDLDLMELLKFHCIINPNTNDTFKFEHEIIGDFLASKILSKSWKRYFKRFKAFSNYDDMLFFVSNWVTDKNKSLFIKKVYSIDVLLSVYCVKEMCQENQIFLEKILLNRYNAKDSELNLFNFKMALGILKTDKSISFLNQILKDEIRDRLSEDQIFYTIKALAIAEDENIINYVLNEVDSVGYITQSGGLLPIWEFSNPKIKLKLARKRIQCEFNKIDRSLITILNFGDISDYDSLYDVINKTEIFPICKLAFKCLYKFDYQRTIDELNKLSQKEINIIGKYLFYNIEFSLAGNTNTSWLISFIFDDFIEQINFFNSEDKVLIQKRDQLQLEQFKAKNNQINKEEIENIDKNLKNKYDKQNYFMDKKSAIKILKECKLSEEDKSNVVDKFKKNNENKHFAWSIVLNNFQSLDFLFIIDTLNNGDHNDLYSLISFILKFDWTKEQNKQFYDILNKRLNDDKKLIIFPCYDKIIEYYIESGYMEIGIENIKLKIENIKLLPNNSDSSLLIGSKLQSILPIISKYSNSFDNTYLLNLLDFDLAHFSLEPEILKILEKIPPSDIDEKIKKIVDQNKQLWLLSFVSKLGKTKCRKNLFVHYFSIVDQILPHKEIEDCLINLWDIDISLLLFESVLKLKWESQIFQYNITDAPMLFNGIKNFIAFKIQYELDRKIVIKKLKKLLKYKMNIRSKKILLFWLDTALTKRKYKQ